MTDGDTTRWHSPLVGSKPVVTGVASLLGALVLLTPQGGQAQLFEDPPAIIQADEALSEEQNDHVEAVALFAHGRVLLQRGLLLDSNQRREQFAAALRRFQRAWWFDHELVSILEDIVPLTFELERPFEATRYLIIAAEQLEVSDELLERVAAELADLDQFDQDRSERALKLYLKLKQQQGAAVSAITQFQIGRLSLTTGKFTQAAVAFAAVQQALERNDTHRVPTRLRDQLMKRPEATYGLFGESYLRAKQLDKAEAAFRRADQGKPDPAVLAFRLALVENERGNKAESLKLLQQYFDANTKSADLAPYVLLTELIDGPISPSDRSGVKESGNSDSATSAKEHVPDDNATQPTPRKPSNTLLEKLQQLADANMDNPLLGYYLADALRRAEKWDEAETLYKKLLEQEPAADGYQGLVDIYRRQERFASLLTQLGAVVSEVGSLNPLDDMANTIAQDEAMLDQLVEQAKILAADAKEPPPAEIWLALALLHAASEGNTAQRSAAAMEFFDAGLKQPIPTAGQCAVNLAFAMFQSNQPELAARVFRRILDEKLLPDRSAEIYFYLAGALTLAKDPDKALAAAREAARLEPNSPRMLTREAWVLFQAKRLPEARVTYLELLDKYDSDHANPENREVMRDIRLALSAIDVELKNTDAAEEWLQQTLDEFPNNIGAYNDLGYLWSESGRHLNRSLRMVQKAVEAEPDNIAYLDSLGWAFYRLERFEEALEPLEKAAAGGDVDGVILDHLGDAYVKTNQPAKAVEAWHKATAALKEQGDAERREAIERKIKQHARQ